MATARARKANPKVAGTSIVPTEGRQTVLIPPPDIHTVAFALIGTAPYVQLRFSEKLIAGFKAKFEEEAPSSKKKVRSKRDYQADFLGAQHVSEKGWCGVPAGAFRAGMISACRLVDFKMTLAKLSVFVDADGFDKVDGTPLVKIEGKPELLNMIVRNANGQPDLRTRAMWKKWSIKLRVKYDRKQFSHNDIANLVNRVGAQVGIGEGRPDSKSSAGMGWGTFRIGDDE
jgi:hypothetical protein